jgi:arylsulfatase
VVNGIPQDPIDGASFARTLSDRTAAGGKPTQYFEIMASRAIYHDGWMASAFGPRPPWVPGLPPGIDTWTPDHDVWELYHLDEDWSQNRDLAAEHPEKLSQMKEMFAIEAARNQVLPIGGALWVVVYHPEQRITPPYTSWELSGDIVRMPEFCAPALGNKNNLVTLEVDVPADANGVLYALGGAGGGLTCFVADGHLCYEYNLFIIMRTKIRAAQPLPVGSTTIEVETAYAEARPGGPLDVTLTVGGTTFATGRVPVSAPLLFTANDCLDIGTCLGSPVSMDYYDRAPFPFNGRIGRVHVAYT